MRRTEVLARGLWGVLATPFTADASTVDDTALRRQVELHHAAGSRGLVVLGVFGEGARLGPAEQDHVVAEVTASAGDLPIVVGLSALDTEEAVGAARRLAAHCRGALPSFMVQVNTTDPGALAAHLGAIHEATGAGIVVQDYPVASGVHITGAALAEAVRNCPCAVAVKSEAPPTSAAIAELTARLDIPVFGGLGGIGLLDELMAGAAGAMTGFSYPEALASVLTAFASGGYAAARQAYLPWLPLVNFEAQVKIGLGIRKASLVERGIFASAAVRPPAPPISEALLPLLRAHLAPVRERGVR
ncbi:MAG TPA: dihydrodipicolinate synthase family protein [Amycolatopsis sp.]|jgi:4-hydroxy-tetrahydrodipicolinate synthase|nr:dihydrodipicolinate synthase family protein [Amycolatopsis sp.]